MPDEINERVRNLERWRAEQETRIAVEKEQRKHMDERFDKVDGDLREIKGAFWKVLWAIAVVFIGVGANFVLRGGLIGG